MGVIYHIPNTRYGAGEGLDVDTLARIAVDDLLVHLAQRLDDATVAFALLARPTDTAGRIALVAALAENRNVSWPLSQGIAALATALDVEATYRTAALDDALTCFAGLGLSNHPGVVIARESEDPVAALAAGELVVAAGPDRADMGGV